MADQPGKASAAADSSKATKGTRENESAASTREAAKRDPAPDDAPGKGAQNPGTLSVKDAQQAHLAAQTRSNEVWEAGERAKADLDKEIERNKATETRDKSLAKINERLRGARSAHKEQIDEIEKTKGAPAKARSDREKADADLEASEAALESAKKALDDATQEHREKSAAQSAAKSALDSARKAEDTAIAALASLDAEAAKAAADSTLSRVEGAADAEKAVAEAICEQAIAEAQTAYSARILAIETEREERDAALSAAADATG
ncbi:MAG: hypothetical protein AAFU80_02140 [Pseudomonadota bacterium]